MQNIKNIGVGFLVSFIGSIPLGYLNVVGFNIYQATGFDSTISYLLGVVCIEFFVIYFTLTFAHKLIANKKLTQFIEAFSIAFMFILAAVFYFGSGSENHSRTVFSNNQDNYFFAGLLFSSLNFIQIPFWTGWNLWLLNGNYIEVSRLRKYFYVFGTVVGTFCGMLLLILSLHYFATNVDFLSNYLMKYIIPAVFVGFGVFQSFKFYKKYSR